MAAAEATIEDVASRVVRAVVSIESDAIRGTGFFTNGGLILSNAHVVGGQGYVKVTFGDGLNVPARSAIGVRLNITNKVGALYFQDASYSYRSYHWPTEWDHVGVYEGGKLVWGVEPRDWDAQQQQKLAEKQQRGAAQAKS